MPKAKKKEKGPVIEGRRRGLNTGLHHTFWNGRIVVGSDWKNVLGTTFLIAAPVGIFFGFEANPIGTSISWAVVAVVAFLFLLSLAFLFCTAFVDPGFIPRDGEDHEPDDACSTKEFVVNGYVVQTKWCTTCNHYRPPRCSHCAACDNCVRKFDHHCPWVGTCVGERNYRFFMAFLLTTTALDCLVFAFSWVRLVYLVNNDNMSWKGAVKHEPANVALMIYTFLFFFFVGGLGALHVFFTSQNVTTYEHFRSRYNAAGNPYDLGLVKNWASVFCHRPPARLKETLPFRVVEDPLENPLQVESHNDPEQQMNGDVELSRMEQGNSHYQSGRVSGRQSIASTVDYSDLSDEGASTTSGQRRIPMVNNLGTVNRNVLDSSDSDLSTSEVDHIRTNHSVVVVHDDTAGSPMSSPSISADDARPAFGSGFKGFGVEDTASHGFPQEAFVSGAASASHSQGPPQSTGSLESARAASYPGSLASHQLPSKGDLGLSTSGSNMESSSSQQGVYGSPPIGKGQINTDDGVPSSSSPSQGFRPDSEKTTGSGGKIEEGLAEKAGSRQLPTGFQAARAQSAQNLSDDETQYGSPRALSVWPSSEVESFRTAGSIPGDIEAGSLPASRQGSVRSLANFSSPSRPQVMKADIKPESSQSKPTPVHNIGTVGESEQVTRK